MNNWYYSRGCGDELYDVRELSYRYDVIVTTLSTRADQNYDHNLWAWVDKTYCCSVCMKNWMVCINMGDFFENFPCITYSNTQMVVDLGVVSQVNFSCVLPAINMDE